MVDRSLVAASPCLYPLFHLVFLSQTLCPRPYRDQSTDSSLPGKSFTSHCATEGTSHQGIIGGRARRDGGTILRCRSSCRQEVRICDPLLPRCLGQGLSRALYQRLHLLSSHDDYIHQVLLSAIYIGSLLVVMGFFRKKLASLGHGVMARACIDSVMSRHASHSTAMR